MNYSDQTGDAKRPEPEGPLSHPGATPEPKSLQLCGGEVEPWNFGPDEPESPGSASPTKSEPPESPPSTGK